MTLKGRTDLFDLQILDPVHKYYRMRISHGNSGKAVLFSVDRDRFSDFRRRNRTSHIHRHKFHLSILYFHGQVLDPGRSLHVDLRFIYDPVIIGIFSYTADPVSAHGTTGSVQIIHIHLAVRYI